MPLSPRLMSVLHRCICVNIVNPSGIILEQAISITGALRSYAKGNYVYVVDNISHLYVVDITIPNKMQIVSVTTTGTNPRNLYVDTPICICH